MKDTVKKFTVGGNDYFFNGENLTFYKDEYNDKSIENENKCIADIKLKKNILINIANICNLDCVYCFAKGGNYGKREELMTLQTAQSLIDKIKMIKRIGILTFFGGEPTLNFEIIKFFTEKLGDRVERYSIITNGTLIDKKQLEFYNAYNFNLIFSLDGPKNIHDILRGGYDNTIKNIRLATNYKNISIKISCQYTPIHLEKSISIKSLHNFFKSTFEKTPYSITPVISDYCMGKFSEKQIKDGLNEIKWEIKQTFDYLTLEINDKHVYSKSVVKTLERVIFKRKAMYFCGKCSSNQNINFDINGAVYPCHMFFGKNSMEITTEIDEINNKEKYPCNSCWAKYLCEICPGAIVKSRRNFFEFRENCENRNRIKLILESLLEVFSNQKKYEFFSKRLTKLIIEG